MPRLPFNKDVIDREQWLQTLSLAQLRQMGEIQGISRYETLTKPELVRLFTLMTVTNNPLSTPKTGVQ